MSTKVFSAIALFALTNGALINLIMASRLVYGMSREGIVPPRARARAPRGAGRPTSRSPSPRRWRPLLVIVGDLETLADTTVLLLLFVFVCVNTAVLVLRREPVDHEHFRAPTALPVLGGIACVALIIQKAFDEPVTFAYAGGLHRARDRPVGDHSSDAFSVIGDAFSATETGQFSFAASAAWRNAVLVDPRHAAAPWSARCR